jgi:hypothetical protein
MTNGETEHDVSIFICWSGQRSKCLAKAVQELLRDCLALKPEQVFVSDELEKGITWFDSIIKRVRKSNAGIVCLTAENLESPWLHFEAGALASHFWVVVSGSEQTDTTVPSTVSNTESRVFTLLHNVNVAELKGPLSAYQATSTTKKDMDLLVNLLAKTLKNDASNSGIPDEHWNVFQKSLDDLTSPVRDLILDFESLFQRKSFNEPLHHCSNQMWVKRYEGTCLVRESLSAHRLRVRAACPQHEQDLFDMLLAELDGYAMAMGSLLLKPKKFGLGRLGELKIKESILTCCEDRRLAIRSLASRLLYPKDAPMREEEAVRFIGAETNEERKMIVHRLEGKIRSEWEQTRVQTLESGKSNGNWMRAVSALVSRRQEMLSDRKELLQRVIDFRRSPWDLDRIYYYLLVQYFCTGVLASGLGTDGRSKQPDEIDFLCAARDVEMEVERYRAKSKGHSLSPLTYALVALCELGPQRAPPGCGALSAISAATALVKTDLSEVLKSGVGRPIRCLLKEIDEAVKNASKLPVSPGQSDPATQEKP